MRMFRGARAVDGFNVFPAGFVPVPSPEPSEPVYTVSKTRTPRTTRTTRTYTTAAVFSTRTASRFSKGTNTTIAAVGPTTRSLSIISSATTAVSPINPSSTASSTITNPAPTNFATHVFTQPTPGIPPSPDNGFSLHLPMISIALIAGGASVLAIVVFIVLRRFFCASSPKRKLGSDAREKIIPGETPLFGTASSDEKYTVMSLDSWSSGQESLHKGMGRMSVTVNRQGHQKRISLSQRGIGLDGPTNGWNILGDLESAGVAGFGTRGVIQPSYSHDQAYGMHLLDNVNASQQQNKPRLPLLAATGGGFDVLPQYIQQSNQNDSGSPILAVANNSHITPTRPLQLRRPQNTTSPSNVSHPELSSTTNVQSNARQIHSILKPQPAKLPSATPPARPIRPARGLKMSDEISLEPYNTFAAAPFLADSESNLSKRPLNAIGTSLSVSASRQTANRTMYRPTSGRPRVTTTSSGSNTFVNNHSSATGGLPDFSHDLHFPLPPGSATTLASSSSLPYEVSKSAAQRNSRSKQVSRRVSVARSRKTSITTKPSTGFANLGDAMLNGFGESDISGDDGTDIDEVYETVTATRVTLAPPRRTGRGYQSDSTYSDDDHSVEGSDTSSQDVQKQFFIVSPQSNQKALQHLPSITITATNSADSLRRLNRRLSRAAAAAAAAPALPPWSKVSTLIPRTPPSPPSHFDSEYDSADDSRVSFSRRTTGAAVSEWKSLAEMAAEGNNPEYHSATYSVYGRYCETEAGSPDRRSMPNGRDRGTATWSAPSNPKTTTLSTIYSDYHGLPTPSFSKNGIAPEEDIGASFAEEVGASLGRIKFS